MSRIRSLDLARGFTVLMMAPVHSVLLYSHPSIYETLLVKSLAFIAEGPGAQLFMTLMGAYVALSKTNSFGKVYERSIWIFIGGYALNVFKFVIPLVAGKLPIDLLNDLQIPVNSTAWVNLLSIGDIFHFAAITLLIIGGLRKYRGYSYLALLSAISVLIVSPLIWDIHTGYAVIDWFLQLFVGRPPQVFFPIFPWLVYPLCGLTIGFFIQRNRAETFRSLRDIGVLLIFFQYLYRKGFPSQRSIDFYRTPFPETLQHLGIVFISLFVWDWLSNHVLGNRFFQLLQYSSRHITKLYIMQWIIIIWCLPIVGYQQLQFLSTIAWMVLTTVATYAIVYIIMAYQEFASITNK